MKIQFTYNGLKSEPLELPEQESFTVEVVFNRLRVSIDFDKGSITGAATIGKIQKTIPNEDILIDYI